MFEPNKGRIPGYTGHQKHDEEVDQGARNRVATKQIPGKFDFEKPSDFDFCAGYAGYIPGVASENVFGQTYGKATYNSSAGNFPKGVDLPAHVKYGTSMKDQFVDHLHTQSESVASTVGVQRDPCTYKKVRKSVTCSAVES